QRAQLISEQAARAEAEAAQRRFAFLAEASTLLAASLDYETTLQSVARLAVPYLADLCLVDVVEGDGTVHRVAAACSDPSKQDLVTELRRYAPDPTGPEGVPSVLRTGQSQLYDEIPLSLLSAASRDDRHLEILRNLGLKSSIIVPLVARQRTLGAISFASMQSGSRYGTDGRSLADDVARRCALAIDNARLYREAQEAIQARDEFLSVAAHELKTPVTSLRGFAQLMIRQLHRNGTVDMPRIARALQVIDQQSIKLSHLVSQLLDASRIEAGRLVLERREANLARLVEDLATTVQANTSRHSLVVRAPGEVMALVDPLRLEQVLTNLLDNAIKYSPEGGPIEIAVSQPAADTVELAVQDRGIGIPSEKRPLIFDRFYQAHGDGHFGGMGLGLYISRQIVQLHGGTLRAEFPTEGGTRFVVTLPTGWSPPSPPTAVPDLGPRGHTQERRPGVRAAPFSEGQL
ncbi:MAG: HAMP domain-containing histidine kinase, partial [Chloroflexi bacterium]|nr:HAMP domain-containing histidine kinase [Chloroflexota bacterium]